MLSLSGILHRQLFWGSPNFGEHPETDKRYLGWILHLDSPLRVLEGPDSSDGDSELRDIQIRIEYGSPLNKNMERLVMRHIVITGNVLVAVLPSDNTPVVQWVIAAQISDKHLTSQCVRVHNN